VPASALQQRNASRTSSRALIRLPNSTCRAGSESAAMTIRRARRRQACCGARVD